MKLLYFTAVAAALVSGASAASCAISTLSKILLDPYLDQCGSDSGYTFTSGVQPDAEEVAGMCASDACHSLLSDVLAMNLTECTLPLGNNIYLFADLVDYVSDQCDAATPVPVTATSEPVSSTPEPTTATPEPTTATPAPTTAVASCTSAQLRYLLTSSYESQCATDASYTFTSPYSPTEAQVAAMCASTSCVNLFAYAASMVTTDCRIPVGGKILLLADLVDYVTDQCVKDTPAPTTAVPTPTPLEPTTVTPAPTTALTSCTSAQLKFLLTSTYNTQCSTDASYSFTFPYTPSEAQIEAMCASTSCINLFAYVSSMVTTDCRIPVGGKILLLADLVDYVPDQCEADTPAPATATPEPTAANLSTPTPSTATPVTTCKTSALTALLTDQYIDQCASDSGYSFTSGVQPNANEVAGMCASTACAGLLADVDAMGLSECILPIGDKIYLFADLVDYVADQCAGSAGSSGSSSSPSTPSPATDPATETPSTNSSSTPSTNSPSTEPTTDTPEPTTPEHNAC